MQIIIYAIQVSKQRK